jgi:hypothetical protein
MQTPQARSVDNNNGGSKGTNYIAKTKEKKTVRLTIWRRDTDEKNVERGAQQCRVKVTYTHVLV